MYDHVQSFADGQKHIFSYFQSYGLENKSVGGVLRVKFDGGIRFCVAPSKSAFLWIVVDFFDVFCDLFVFSFVVKLQ